MDSEDMESNATTRLSVDNNIIHDPFIISDGVLEIFNVVNYVVICKFFVIFGSVTNVLNMVVFVKIGFRETINTSLFALALSDFGSCITLLWANIARNPWFQELDLPFDPFDASYLFSSWPHVLFTRVTTMITAFIMFERSLCVAMPLKVKTIITRRRVLIFNIGAYLLMFGSAVPLYYTDRLGLKFYDKINKSLIGLIFTDNREEISAVYGPVLNICFAFLPFVFICICTAILAVSLKRTAHMRGKITAITQTNDVTTKETKVAKMVMIISTVFIVCFSTNMISNTILTVDYDFSFHGKYRNLMMIISTFVFTMEVINSAMNIFIYYSCSSKYHDMFVNTFRSFKKSGVQRTNYPR